MADRLQELVDRADIGDVLCRYSTALDSRDWEALGSVFTPDAVCDYGALGSPRGVPAIAGLVSATIGSLDATQHLLGNVTVAVDGDTATADCYLVAQHVRAGTPGGDDYLLGGPYHDELVRTPEGWRITSRTLHRTWTSGNRDVVQRSGRG